MTVATMATPTTDAPILLRHDVHGMAMLTLNRPRQSHALSEALIAALHTALDSIAQDYMVWVVVLVSNGPACGSRR